MSTVGCKQKDGKTTVYIIKLSRDYVEAIDSIIVYCHHACIIVHASTCEGRRGGSLGIALVFVTLLSHLSTDRGVFRKSVIGRAALVLLTNKIVHTSQNRLFGRKVEFFLPLFSFQFRSILLFSAKISYRRPFSFYSMMQEAQPY
jgi:hypothetical protein